MKIKKITFQIRRDFTAIYECEHCGNTEHVMATMMNISIVTSYQQWFV